MEEELTQYFNSLVKEPSNDQEKDIKNITNHIRKIFSNDHNKMIMRKVELQDIEEVVMSMPNGKAPEPNGFTIDFYKVCHPILKHDVHVLTEESRIQMFVLKALNITFLTLIPKGDLVDSLDKFPPIALCNVIYKIISKVLVNRLKNLLPLFISCHKSGYV